MNKKIVTVLTIIQMMLAMVCILLAVIIFNAEIVSYVSIAIFICIFALSMAMNFIMISVMKEEIKMLEKEL